MEPPLQIIRKYRSLAPEGKLLLMLGCKRMNINLPNLCRDTYLFDVCQQSITGINI